MRERWWLFEARDDTWKKQYAPYFLSLHDSSPSSQVSRSIPLNGAAHDPWTLGPCSRGRNACQHRLARYFLWNGHRPLMSHPVLSYSFFSLSPLSATTTN